MFLCFSYSRFTPKFSDGNISLDYASKTLSVVRRRIYDVVNVLQSIGIVERKGKNSYLWLGAQGMRNTLAEIKDLGFNSQPSGPTKRGESLGALSRKFVALFLESQDGVVLSLENAATGMQKKDTGTPDKSGATKTKGWCMCLLCC